MSGINIKNYNILTVKFLCSIKKRNTGFSVQRIMRGTQTFPGLDITHVIFPGLILPGLSWPYEPWKKRDSDTGEIKWTEHWAACAEEWDRLQTWGGGIKMVANMEYDELYKAILRPGREMETRIEIEKEISQNSPVFWCPCERWKQSGPLSRRLKMQKRDCCHNRMGWKVSLSVLHNKFTDNKKNIH